MLYSCGTLSLSVCHATQLKDAVIHGTASEIEFTILETLKLILMEVLHASQDREECIKERTAAAAERIAASEERRAAAAERQAICTSLDRVWSVLMKTSIVGSDQRVSPLQQTVMTQSFQADKMLVATDLVDLIHCDGSDKANTENKNDGDNRDFANVACSDQGSSVIGVDYDRQSIPSTALKIGVTFGACTKSQDHCSNNLVSSCKDTACLPSIVENQDEAAQYAITSMPNCAELAFIHPNSMKQSPCTENYVSLKSEMTVLEPTPRDCGPSSPRSTLSSSQACSFIMFSIFEPPQRLKFHN
jgi:hypothetical protein